MNDINFKSWLSIVGPLGVLMFTMFAYLFRKVERNDERWLDTQGKILTIMNKLQMIYTDPNAMSQVRENEEKR